MHDMENNAFVNDIPFEIISGETILEFVRRTSGPDLVPTLCQAGNLENYGSCRICSVEVALYPNGPSRVMAACHTPVARGYYIYTSTEKIKKLRQNIIELILTDYPADKVHPEPGRMPTEFQKTIAAIGIPEVRYPKKQNHHEKQPDRSHPYIWSDLAQCIYCYRCIRACDELQSEHILGISGRGYESRIIKGPDADFIESGCVSCGACVQTCPTNALSDRYGTKTIMADKTVRTTCTYCGVGCNLEVKVKDGRNKGNSGACRRNCQQGPHLFERTICI